MSVEKIIVPSGRLTFGELLRPTPRPDAEMVILTNPEPDDAIPLKVMREATYRTEFKLQPYRAEGLGRITETGRQLVREAMDNMIAAAFLVPARRFGKTVTSTTAAETAIKMDEMRKRLEERDNTQIPRIHYSKYSTRPTSERLFPFSRHRSARIEKKLIQRFGGVYRHEPAIYQLNGLIIAHPSFRAEIEKKLEEAN